MNTNNIFVIADTPDGDKKKVNFYNDFFLSTLKITKLAFCFSTIQNTHAVTTVAIQNRTL